MLITSNAFVTNVAEMLMANFAFNVVAFTSFHIYGFAILNWAQS